MLRGTGSQSDSLKRPAQPLRGHMELDTDKIDQAVLALLALGKHEGYRTWKAFDWEVMGRLHEKGYITDPVGKAKSVLFTEEGARESERLLQALFSRSPDRDSP
jgi:DNA-binding PadR family transcriptional regulator